MCTDYKLSPHFTFSELTYTLHDELQEANRADVTAHEEMALRALCANILEPVRALFGVPLIIHSGFRCELLNSKVGGSDTSQHRKGEAADFHVRGLDDEDGISHAFERIRKSAIPYGQLIDEYNGRARWLHISLGYPFREASESGQKMLMRIVDGKTTYSRAL